MTPELPELHGDQVPTLITSDEQLHRWRLCVGVTLQVAGRFDLQFASELYFGDLPTGNEQAQLVLDD